MSAGRHLVPVRRNSRGRTLRDAMHDTLNGLLVDAHEVPEDERREWAWKLAATARRTLRSEAARAATPAEPGLLDRIDGVVLAEIVSDSLAATTEGTAWDEAPEPSDEPGSPYVLRLTNEIHARIVLRGSLASFESGKGET